MDAERKESESASPRMGDSGMSSGRSGTSSKGEDRGCFDRGSNVEMRDRRGLTTLVGVIGVGVMTLWAGTVEAVDSRSAGFESAVRGAEDNLAAKVVDV